MATYYPDYEEPACPICGSTTLWEDCDNCGGEGTLDVYEEDPLWYDEGDTVICDWCAGRGRALYLPEPGAPRRPAGRGGDVSMQIHNHDDAGWIRNLFGDDISELGAEVAHIL